MSIRYKSAPLNLFMRTISCFAALLLLLVLVIVLVSPTSDSFPTALRGKEKASIILLSMAVAAMLLIAIAPRASLLAYPARFAVIHEVRSAYPPVYMRDCVLRC